MVTREEIVQFCNADYQAYCKRMKKRETKEHHYDRWAKSYRTYARRCYLRQPKPRQLWKEQVDG